MTFENDDAKQGPGNDLGWTLQSLNMEYSEISLCENTILIIFLIEIFQMIWTRVHCILIIF